MLAPDADRRARLAEEALHVRRVARDLAVEELAGILLLHLNSYEGMSGNTVHQHGGISRRPGDEPRGEARDRPKRQDSDRHPRQYEKQRGLEEQPAVGGAQSAQLSESLHC